MRQRQRRRARPEDNDVGILLPVQFSWRRLSAAIQPEQRLMLAVLEEAVHDALQIPPPRNAPEVLAWIASDDTSWPYSFANLCDALDLDRGAVRRALERRRHRRTTASVAA